MSRYGTNDVIHVDNLQLITQQRAGQFIARTDRTIRNLISKGLLTGYVVTGVRGTLVDFTELQQLVRKIPTVDGRRAFGPNAKVVRIGAPAVVVAAGEDR